MGNYPKETWNFVLCEHVKKSLADFFNLADFLWQISKQYRTLRPLYQELYTLYGESRAARPERSSFCEEERRTKQRERRTEIAAQKLIILMLDFM